MSSFLCGQWSLGVGFARALRVAFQHHPQFHWDPDEAQSKIHIYDSYPLRGVRFPSIIINVTGGNALFRGIGEEYADVDNTPVSINGLTYGQQTGTIFSGNLKFGVTLSVYARSAFERAEIADWAVLFIRHFATDKIRREGVEIESLNVGPQTVELVGADPVYGVTVTVGTMTSFYREIPIAESQTLRGICITGVFTILDGATYAESFIP